MTKTQLKQIIREEVVNIAKNKAPVAAIEKTPLSELAKSIEGSIYRLQQSSLWYNIDEIAIGNTDANPEIVAACAAIIDNIDILRNAAGDASAAEIEKTAPKPGEYVP